MLRHTIDYSAYLAVRMLICLIQAVRIETCQTIARGLAVLACDIIPLRRKVIDDNLRHAFPQYSPRQRKLLARRMWEHLFLMVCEIAHVPRKVHDANWHEHVRFERKRELVRQLLDRRPTVVISGHYGNFEVAGYVCALLGFPTYSIARPLDNPYLNTFVNSFRERKGQYILPKIGSSGRVQEILDAGGTMALLGDQHAGPKGCWVEFMGRPASCHKAISLFTLSTGAPLVVSFAVRDGAPLKFLVGLGGIADPKIAGPELAGVRQLTQWYNEKLGDLIRLAPDQYWWVHRRWKGEPPQRMKKAKAA